MRAYPSSQQSESRRKPWTGHKAESVRTEERACFGVWEETGAADIELPVLALPRRGVSGFILQEFNKQLHDIFIKCFPACTPVEQPPANLSLVWCLIESMKNY